MSLLQIAWRNFTHRSLSSALTSFNLALGVALVVLVLAIYGIVIDAFRNNSTLSYNIVVGPPGSALQLTLNSVYYLSQPIENLPYTEYMEFMPQDQRAAIVKKYGGSKALGERDGIFAKYVKGGFTIPLTLGDYYGEFRVVGTTPEFFELLRHGPLSDQKFKFAQGRNFQTQSPENGYFEAVIGSRVAAVQHVKVGDYFNPTHGDPESKGGEAHADSFKIVGVLAPTGTPSDRATYVNMEGFYLMEGHAKPVPTPEPDYVVGETSPDAEIQPLTIPQREVTAILVRNAGFAGVQMMPLINERRQSQAAAPVGEINKLLDRIVGPLLNVLMLITAITCVVAAVGVLVAIYNSMNDRRHDIAVMRALGARRGAVTGVILLESLLIAIVGSTSGWLLAHVAILIASPMIEAHTGVRPHFLTISSFEVWVLPLVLLLAALAGFLPAAVAYRTDVSRNLAA